MTDQDQDQESTDERCAFVAKLTEPSPEVRRVADFFDSHREAEEASE